MTQQEQHEFGESVDGAVAWMRAVQERLRVNDNTQGPRAALEARLRETEVRSDTHETNPSTLTLTSLKLIKCHPLTLSTMP